MNHQNSKPTKQGSCLLRQHTKPYNCTLCSVNATRCSVSWQHKQLSSFSSCVTAVCSCPNGSQPLPFIDAAVSSTERGQGTLLCGGFPLADRQRVRARHSYRKHTANSTIPIQLCWESHQEYKLNAVAQTQTNTRTLTCTTAHSYVGEGVRSGVRPQLNTNEIIIVCSSRST